MPRIPQRYQNRFGLVSGVIAMAVVLISFQNCGENTKTNTALSLARQSQSLTPTTQPTNQQVHPFGYSKLVSCSKPQLIQVPNATVGIAINAYILARGVVGNPNCPDPYAPYVEPYHLAVGTSGSVAGAVQALGNVMIADPVGVFDTVGTLHIFGVGLGYILTYRTLVSNWASLGGIQVLPSANLLCNPKVSQCVDSGFNVTSSFNERKDIHIVVAGFGTLVYMRTLNANWYGLSGIGSQSTPIIKFSTRLSMDVVQTRSGGELCYQVIVIRDGFGNLLQNGAWTLGCDE